MLPTLHQNDLNHTPRYTQVIPTKMFVLLRRMQNTLGVALIHIDV